MSETTAVQSAGALLRAAREKQGLHIAALAAAIKVTPRKLDALENDRWNELPDATFTRALAQTVCRSLKIEAKPILDLLPPAETSALEPTTSTLNTPFNERPGRADGGLAGAAIRPMVIAAALLMVAAVIVYLLPDSVWTASRPAGTKVATAPVTPAPAGPPSTVPTTSPAPADGPSAATGSAVGAATPSPAAAGTAASAPSATPAPLATAPAAAPATATGPAATPAAEAPRGETVFSAPPPGATAAAPAVAGIVQMRVSDASWIEVRDAGGRVLLSRTVLPGEGVGLDGALPLKLTIGNASATVVSFRGRPVDLGPRRHDNVARIELR